MQTWKKREEGIQKIPKLHKVKVPLIVRPLKVPRHTYKKVSLVLFAKEVPNSVYIYWFGKNKHRLVLLKRSLE